MTNGWQTVNIGEIAKPIARAEAPIAGTTYRQIGVRLWGQGAYERESIDGSQTKYATLSRVENGDIVVNKIWARNGSVAVVSDKLSGCFGSGEFPTFAPDRKKLDPRWFHWMTKTKWFWQACDVKSQGTSGKNRIRPEKFLEIEIPLPPLDEQRRIVEHIEALAAHVSKAQSLREEANVETDAFVRSVRNNIVMGYSKKYPMKTLGELCTKITDGPHVSPNYLSKEDGVAFISVRNVSETGLDFSTAKYISRKDHEEYSKRVNIEKGDVLFTKVGSTGTARRVDVDIEFSIWVNLALLKPKRELVDGAFMEHMLNAPTMREHTVSLTFGSSTQYIGLGKIAKIEIPLPPLDEQRRIVAYLDSVQARLASLRQLQSATGEELSALLPSILDKAFKGKL